MDGKTTEKGFLEMFPVLLKKSLTDKDPTNPASSSAMAITKYVQSSWSFIYSWHRTDNKAPERENLILNLSNNHSKLIKKSKKSIVKIEHLPSWISLMVCEPVFRTAVYQMFQKSGQKNPTACKSSRIWTSTSHPNLK